MTNAAIARCNDICLSVLPPLEGEVHVWLIPTNVQMCSHLEAAAAAFSLEERERADSYIFERDRRRFVRSHAWLRSIIARYLRAPPDAVRFRRGPSGKPRLPDPAPLNFNLAHAGELGAIAVSHHSREVGIDLETEPTSADIRTLTRAVLGSAAVAAVAALPAGDQMRTVLRAWTLKESLLKAGGYGLSRPPSEIEVTLEGLKPTIINAPGGRAEIDRWWVRDLAVPAPYVGTLMVEKREDVSPPYVRGFGY